MEFQYFNTSQLCLRLVNPEVLDYVHSEFSDEELMAFYGHQNTESLQKEKDRHAGGLQGYNRTFCYFQILQQGESIPIGWCGFHSMNPEHQRAEIGYGLFAEHVKRQGLMTEAMQFVLDYAHSDLAIHRVEAYIGEDNAASIRLVEKFNFEPEGRLKEHYNVNGVMEDSLLFALLLK